ncbi:MAG: AAA family ATPase [Bacilli bacterium]|nr:AAA family ATPase [Bacilli bacterium]
MSKLIICRGIQGSGKSTWAKAWAMEDPKTRVRFNWDDMRNMMGEYWVPERENTGIMKTLRASFLDDMMRAGWDICIDNMNLNPKDWEFYEGIVKTFNEAHPGKTYEIEYVDFFTPVEECIRRDAMRPHPIGEAVIRATWKRYKHFIICKEIEDKFYSMRTYDATKKDCIIADMDSTLCVNLTKRPFYTDGWKEKLIYDTPLAGPISILRAQKMTGTCDVIIVTGRREDGRETTEEWLETYNVPYDRLYMRGITDYTKGDVFKEKILKEFILPKYNVLFALEDDNKCSQMYRRNGLICLQP